MHYHILQSPIKCNTKRNRILAPAEQLFTLCKGKRKLCWNWLFSPDDKPREFGIRCELRFGGEFYLFLFLAEIRLQSRNCEMAVAVR